MKEKQGLRSAAEVRYWYWIITGCWYWIQLRDTAFGICWFAVGSKLHVSAWAACVLLEVTREWELYLPLICRSLVCVYSVCVWCACTVYVCGVRVQCTCVVCVCTHFA